MNEEKCMSLFRVDHNKLYPKKYVYYGSVLQLLICPSCLIMFFNSSVSLPIFCPICQSSHRKIIFNYPIIIVICLFFVPYIVEISKCPYTFILYSLALLILHHDEITFIWSNIFSWYLLCLTLLATLALQCSLFCM